MSKQNVFFLVESTENGYAVTVQCNKAGEINHKFNKFVFHSLSEVMRSLNTSISGFEMGPIYRSPKSLDFEEAETNISRTNDKYVSHQDC